MLKTQYKVIEESHSHLVYRSDFEVKNLNVILYFSILFVISIFIFRSAFVPLVLSLFSISIPWMDALSAKLIALLWLLFLLLSVQIFSYTEILTFDLSKGLVSMTSRRPLGENTREFISSNLKVIILDATLDKVIKNSSKGRYHVRLTSKSLGSEESIEKSRLMYTTDNCEEAEEAMRKLSYYLNSP